MHPITSAIPPVKKSLLVAITTIFVAQIATVEAAESIPDNQTDNNYQKKATHINSSGVVVAYFDPIVVTATRSDKNLRDSPVSLQVLDKATLDANQAHTLKQALDLLPNVYLSPLHGKTGYAVKMQGFSGDQVLVLIDGLPVSASTGSSFNINQYLNTDVKQIEVIQGAASAQYGSSAMGGVINIITQPITSSSASLTAEVATNGDQNPSDKSFDNNYNFVEGSIEGALTEDQRFKARISGSYREHKGLTTDHQDWPRLKDEIEQKQAQVRFSFTPDSNEVNQTSPSSRYWLEAGYYKEEDLGRFNYVGHGMTIPQQREESIERKRVSLGGQTQLFSKNGDSYRLSGSLLNENYNSDSATKTQRAPTDQRDFDLTTNLAQLQLDLPSIGVGNTQRHDWQLGLKYSKDEMEQQKNNISELTAKKVDRDVTEAYIQDDWTINDNTEVVAGVRYQDDSEFGDHYAPKLAIKHDYYDPSMRRHTFRASVGKGYRIPNLKELYYYFNHSNYGYQVLGNPDLKPEESISYQLGYQTDLTDNVGLTVNGFYNDVEDLIQRDDEKFEIVNGLMTFTYKNVDKAKTYGGDVAIDWAIDPKTTMNLGYSYLNTKNKTTDSDLTFSPEHKVAANVQYQVTDKLQLVQQLRYESKQLVDSKNNKYSPSWWGMDVKANYSATPNFDVYMAINNVFDEQRDTSDKNDQSPIDNRQWLVGASYHF